MRTKTAKTARPGLSLLEVLVALAIFLFALIALGQLLSLGADRAKDVEYHSQALHICQSKIAELAAGSLPLNSQSDMPLDEDPNWQWSLEVEQAPVDGLWNVVVRVGRQQPGGNKIETALSQMILDPSLRGNNSGSAQSPDTSSSGGSTPMTGTGSPSSSPASGSPSGSTRTQTGGTPSSPSSGSGTRPPTGGGTPPSGSGTRPPSGGGTPPSGSGTRPPSGGGNPPAGNPPRGGR